jgi:spoIIIJ-associated protein
VEWVETTAKTVEEAKNLVLDQLGVVEDDAEIVVLDEPRAGLFGRVRGEARVRARVRPTTPRPKLDRRDRKRKDGGRDKPGRGDESVESATETSAEAPVRAPRAAKAGGRRPNRPAGDDQAAAESPAATSDVDTADAASELDDPMSTSVTTTSTNRPAGQARRRGRRGRGGAGRASNATGNQGTDDTEGFDDLGNLDDAARTDVAASDIDGDDAARDADTERAPRRRPTQPRRTRDDADRPSPATAEQRSNDMVDAVQVGDEARKFVQGVVDAFGLEGTASVRQDGDDLEVAVDGNDLGLLVGPRGTTLQALQELARVAAQRRLGDHDTRLRVDVGGYRERRKEALGRFAQQVAAQVVADGSAKRLEPMSSSDRKVIHDVLATFEGVVTRSEGDDPRRCVVIAPADA